MGGNFLGPFAMGLVGTMNRMQAVNSENQYKKALIEQSKLHTKLLENQIAQADAKQGMMNMFLRANGIEPPPQAAQQPMQLPQAQQPQAGIIPALGRMFGFGNAAQAQQPTPPQPLPQAIAQGQMQAQMPGQAQPNRALLNDIMKKQLFDLPGWEERFQAESKQVGRTINTLDPQGRPITIVVDKMNRPMGAFQTPAEPYRQTVQTPQGTFVVPQPKYQMGPPVQVGPPEVEWKESQPTPGGPTVYQPLPKYPQLGQGVIKEQPKGETPESAGKSQAIIGGLQDGLKFLDVIKDRDTGEINQKTIAGMTAPFMGTVGGMPGTNAREGLSLFRNAVDAIVRQRTGAQIRADEWPYYNSIYLPDFKDSPALQQSKIDRLNRDLAGALMQTDPTQTKLGRSLSVTPQLGPTPQGGGITANQIEQEYQQALKQRPDLAPQLKAKRNYLMQRVR